MSRGMGGRVACLIEYDVRRDLSRQKIEIKGFQMSLSSE